MSCVVFGGSGQIGRYLLPLLRARGVPVLACSRHTRADTATDTDADGVQWMRACLPDRVPPLPPTLRAVVCLGPLDHFARWLVQAQLPAGVHVVAMSSMSAHSKRDSPDPPERELAESLRGSEREVLAHCAERGHPCTLLRATLIYGDGDQGALARMALTAMRWRVFPLPRGRGLRQPVHAADLALAVQAALQLAHGAGVVPVGGGERLPATAMFARVRTSLSCRTLPLPLPGGLLRLAAALGGRSRGMVARLDRDLVADNAKLVGLLGVHPRGFVPPPPQGGKTR